MGANLFSSLIDFFRIRALEPDFRKPKNALSISIRENYIMAVNGNVLEYTVLIIFWVLVIYLLGDHVL